MAQMQSHSELKCQFTSVSEGDCANHADMTIFATAGGQFTAVRLCLKHYRHPSFALFDAIPITLSGHDYVKSQMKHGGHK